MTNPKSKRLRIFAGPNGSGKTTLTKKLSDEGKFHLKVFVNADEIEKELRENGNLRFSQYQSKSITTNNIQNFIQMEGMKSEKTDNRVFFNLFEVANNKLYFKGVLNSYIASDIASFLRLRLIEEGVSFAFETVFSHESKLEFMKIALENGYRIYFYFLATDDPDINVNRVDIRVEKHGHAVDIEKIKKRYYRSLELLLEAVKVSSRAYLFDNSGKYFELVAKVDDGKNVEILDIDKQIPNWFVKYFYNKIKA